MQPAMDSPIIPDRFAAEGIQLPQGQEALKISQRELKNKLIEDVCMRDSLDTVEKFPMEFKIPYNPEIPLTNEPIVHNYWNSDLAVLYREITDRFEEKTYWDDTLVSTQEKGIEGISKPETEVKNILADAGQKKHLLVKARQNLALAGEIAPFLYNPPAVWRFFEDRSPKDIFQLPEGINAEQIRHFLYLLTYYSSLTLDQKKRVIASFPTLTTERFLEWIRILNEERGKIFNTFGRPLLAVGNLANVGSLGMVVGLCRRRSEKKI